MRAKQFPDAASSRHDARRDAADLAACRATLRGGSRTFLAASRLLPAAVRDPACALYAFCRLADDAVDNAAASAGDPVALLRQRLAAVYAGQPADCAADRAFAVVVRRHAIPCAWPEALIEGFEWDRAGRRYRTLDELLDYAQRVAGTVGAMMAAVMDTRSPEAVTRACELGCAMQLSNIARDIGEDARMGRIYLPLDWLAEAGIDADDWLAKPVFTPALARVIERLLKVADALYARARGGVAMLPLACRPGIHAARVLYAEIGQQVRRNGLDAVSRRAVVRPARKLGCLAERLVPASIRRRGAVMRVGPLPSIGVLLEPIAQAVAPPRAAASHVDVAPAAVRLIDLFEQLEHRRIARRALHLR